MIDCSGFIENSGQIIRDAYRLHNLREAVEGLIGKVTNEEWEISTLDVASANKMSGQTYHDEMMIQKIIASIDFYRRHKFEEDGYEHYAVRKQIQGNNEEF